MEAIINLLHKFIKDPTEIKNNKKLLKKRITSRNTGFRGVHVHYWNTDKNFKISFRAAFSNNGITYTDYRDFDYDWFGLFSAVLYHDKLIYDNKIKNKEKFLLIIDENIKNDIEIALKDYNVHYLKMKHKQLTKMETFPFEKIKYELLRF